jgi:hypothetical protein
MFEMNIDYCKPKELKLTSCEHGKWAPISLIPVQFYHKNCKIQKLFFKPSGFQHFYAIAALAPLPAFNYICGLCLT